MVIKQFFTATLFLISIAVFGIDFTRVNIAWQYDPTAEIELRHRTIQEGNLMTVFLRFRADSLSVWNVEFLKQAEYDSEMHSLFEGVLIDTLSNGSKEVFSKLTFTKPAEGLMVVKLSKRESFYYYDVPLKNGSLPFPSFCPTSVEKNLPILNNYLNESNVRWLGSNTFFASEYLENFDQADPPMAKMKPLAPSVFPDTTFVFSGSADLKPERFYVIQEDSLSAGGVTVLRAHPYYPELKKLDELLFAMQYILNDVEKKGIQASKNPKQSFDSFWLNTYKTKFRARNAIRNYYNWVEQANDFFTDFKQGWKTDRGMLFIVYGVPDEVYRTGNNEEWYYDQGPAFEFTIIATFFSPRTYALRRRLDLEKSWFEYIAAIRRGSNE